MLLILGPIPSFIYILSGCYVLYQASRLVPFSSLDKKSLYFLRITQCLVFLECLLNIAFNFNGNEVSTSLIICTVLQSCAWLISIIVMSKEAWKVPKWPGNFTVAFFSVEIIVNVIITSVVHGSIDGTFLNTLTGIGLFFVNVSILVLVIFKDQLRSSDEKHILEFERYSVYKSGTQLTPDSLIPLRRKKNHRYSNSEGSNAISLQSVWHWVTNGNTSSRYVVVLMS